MSDFVKKTPNISPPAGGSFEAMTRPVQDDSLPSMFRSKDGLASRRHDATGQFAEEDAHKTGKSWRLLLAAVAVVVVASGAFYQLYILQSPVAEVEAPAATGFAVGGMDEVISAASERFADIANDKPSLARANDDGKRSVNEQLLKRLKAWMDKETDRQALRRGHLP